ncbi:hypothetical protein PFISCL1PPCAC_24055 [Pristionchus fissidentatus]|uniref:DNA replication licensing factor MCM7 n=1 Tax=Pristionchus fissidentatus TaxID=1538716 RepID=A0AAV5WR85_9BILA|nr:hypothetical protein PFISCL1PPCAC_24055 [Pristionchus fissidentatus]
MALDFDKEKEKIREFIKNFYSEDEDGRKMFKYAEQMVELAERTQSALFIDLDDVNEYDPELVESIRTNARRFHQLFCEVMDDLIKEHLGDRDPPVIDALDSFIYQRLTMDKAHKNAEGAMGEVVDPRKKYPPQLLRRYEIMFKNRSLDKAMIVRDIKAAYVGKLVTVGGVVIRAAEVRPMASVMTYTCDTCGAEAYQPVNGPTFNPAVQCPAKDCLDSRANGRLHMQIRGSKMVKYQEIKIQEHSDQVPVGSIPRLLSINVYGESTRTCAPGDSVRITGVLVPLLRQGFKQIAGGLVTEVSLEAHMVENMSTREEDTLADAGELTDEEIEMVSKDNFYDLLAYSIAPEIYGHTDVKKSLLLALVGGVDKNANGMKIRGALNVLLMGDPGVAKSQLLSYVDRLAPRSQYTTGRGSSGVGLTAAVMKDQHTGEMTLEGGALVLADRGICCIDEFDKMVDADRTAIHEVMEQQTISIAKAGILTTLNARVSIIAAANPAFGRYNPRVSIEKNIDLPAALLSRFDVLWLMQDKADREADKRLAEHITYVHMKGHQPEIIGMKPLDMVTVRRYIAMCKKKEPVVEEKLREKLVEMYVEMRRESRESDDSTFTSPRLLLSVIRMATALARLRLSDRVNSSDIDESIRLMHSSKSSLRPELREKEARLSPTDVVFGVLRELNTSSKGPIEWNAAMQKISKKGLSEEELDKTVSHYSSLGVLMVDRHRRIAFTVN